MLRLAIVGFGAIGQALARMLQTDPKVRVVQIVVSSRSLGAAKGVAAGLAPDARAVLGAGVLLKALTIMHASLLCAARRALRRAATGAMLVTALAPDAVAQDSFAAERKQMLEDIARTTHETRFETGRATLSDRVMQAMARVPRHRLVRPGEERDAYRNRALRIEHGQTISQPFIVALMTDLLEIGPGSKVLEVGTGSGYQAAVLAEIGAHVYTIEIIEPLARDAARRLTELGYRNIETRIGDGYQGWPEHAPFDAIIVTAAAREVPPPLVEQLKRGGRLVIPLGDQSGVQTLHVVEKSSDGTLRRRPVLAVRFVPLTGRGK